MDLSIVIVHYKAPDLLGQCIKSITSQYPELVGKFVIVDNSPEKKTKIYIKENFPKERYIPSRKNVGFASAVNWGINNTDSKYVLVLNQDIVVKEKALEKLCNFMEENHDVAVVGPKLIYTDQEEQRSCCRFYTPKIVVYRRTFLGRMPSAKRELAWFTMENYDRKKTRDVDWIAGAAMLFRPEALDEVGMFDERFFFYFEDVDLCRRFWENGWRVVYYPEAIMTHYHTRESAEKTGLMSITNKMTRIHIQSGVKYFMKYRGRKESPKDLYLQKKKDKNGKRITSNVPA